MRQTKRQPSDDEPREEVDPELLDDEDEDLGDDPEVPELEETEAEVEVEEGEEDEPDPEAEDEGEEIEFANAKFPSDKELRSALEWAFSSETDVEPALLDRYAEHARLMLEASKRMNLTKIIDAKDALDYHQAMQGVLKGWLFLHIPLTYMLMLTVALHAIIMHTWVGGIR